MIIIDRIETIKVKTMIVISHKMMRTHIKGKKIIIAITPKKSKNQNTRYNNKNQSYNQKPEYDDEYVVKSYSTQADSKDVENKEKTYKSRGKKEEYYKKKDEGQYQSQNKFKEHDSNRDFYKKKPQEKDDGPFVRKDRPQTKSMVQMDKKEDVQKLTKSGKDDYVRKEDPVQKQTPAPKAVDTKNQFMSQLQIMNGDEEDSDDDDEDTKMWIKEKSEPSKKNSPIKKSPIKSSPVKELKKPTPEPVVVDNKKTIEYQIQKTPTK